jgi:hypothetical protein
MWSLRLEDGRMWGEAAQPFQMDDAEAILLNNRDNEDPDQRATWHFLTRPRGGSKSTDIAGVAISWLVHDAPPLANGHVVASSTEQAAIIIDAVAAFVARTPELDGALLVESKRVLAPNGAWVEVLAQSDSGAWGLRDAHLLVCDEFCQWPETRGARRVWVALQSAAPKVANCKLIILSSAGEPSHWSYEVYQKCQGDPLWRVREAPGPVPWMGTAELESLRGQLRPSEYDRLVLNIWSADEERGISPEDYDFAAQEYKSLQPHDGVKYIITVDVGVVNDATVMTISHKEPLEEEHPRGLQRVVIDHIERWKGTKKKPIQLSKVESWLIDASHRWNRAPVFADPTQFVGNIQNLNKHGVRAKEWPFTTTSVGELAAALVHSFRNRQIWVPKSAILKDELLRVRLRETSPGVARLDHDRGGHDDQAVTIGMACRIHLGGTGGVGANFREFMERDTRRRAEAAAENEQQTEAQRRTERAINRRRQGVRSDRLRSRKMCVHRWSPDRSYCVFCGELPEKVG